MSIEPDEIPIEERPDTIYHYCSLSSFVSIVESKHLWLSDAYALNDSKENRWYLKYIMSFLQHFKSSDPNIIEELQEVYERCAFNDSVPYISSFSEKADRLSQWRAYADDGRGVAIGFNPNTFGLRFRAPDQGGEIEWSRGIAKVVYNQDSQRSIIHDIIGEVIESFNKRKSGRTDILFINCFYSLVQLAPIFKNPAFEEEKEWRIIYIPEKIFGDPDMMVTPESSKLSFRSTGSDISMYFQLPFWLDENVKPINEVILGPKCQVDHSKIQKLLNYNGYQDVSIQASTASYR